MSEAPATKPPEPYYADELEKRRLLREGWTSECIDSERRFGHRAARLYPLIGVSNGVLTPLGPATLLHAFEDAPGRPGALVMPLRPRAFITEWNTDGSVKRRRAAAVRVPVGDVKPYRKES